MIRRPLVSGATAGAVAVVALAALISSMPHLAFDQWSARAIQSIDLGPLTVLFPVFRWAGGAPGAPLVAAAAVALVLLFNRRAWLLAVAVLAGSAWYPILIFAVHRPRPSAYEVLRVTEHPGGTSFPSGHVLFLALDLAVVLLCVGYRYLPDRERVAAWCLVGATVLLVGISRVYVGAHWPTDVLAAMLIAATWLALVVSMRTISHSALEPSP